MKTKLSSAFRFPLSIFTVTAAFALFAAAARAPAQTVWTNALSFDGTNDYVVFDRPVSNDFTIECWFRTVQTAGWADQWWKGMGLVDGEAAGFVSDFGLALGEGKVCFGTGGTNELTISSGVIADGAWHHAAAARRQSSGVMQLYVDGLLVATGTNGTGSLASSPQMRLGSLATGANFFQGDLDEVRIWRAVRTVEEIRRDLGHPLSGTESNLAAYWRLDEGAGSTAFDSTANGCNGTVNGARWVSSSIPPWGTALSLDGTDDAATVTGLTLTNTSLTIEVWARRASTNTHDGFVGQGTNSSGNGLVFGLFNNGTVGFTFYAGGLFAQVNADTNWHHWVATRDQTTGARCLYQDGLLLASDTNTAPYTGSGTFWIGHVPFDTGPYFHGQLDEVRIWNRVRSQAEIRADSCRPLTGTESNLVAYYRFDERSGAAAYDSTAYGHNAAVAGAVWTSSTIPPFVNINAGLTGVYMSSVAWGDYDNDGRLDYLLTGNSDSGQIAQVWRNTGNGFSNINAGLPGVLFGSVAWGDYDNDGRLDYLLSGDSDSGRIAQVWRNTGNGFININAGLPGVYWSSVAWGDYDNDGRLDILLTGGSDSGPIAQVWRNTGNGFTNINAGLTGVDWGSVAWGDYDNDGLLDILLSGDSDSGQIAQVWRNTGDGLTNINAGLPGVGYGSVAWGDYDNDGRLDILLSGDSDSGRIAQVWRNTGDGFTNINAGLPGVYYGSVAWGDYDNDGRLDILRSGDSDSGRIAQVWRNTGNGFTNVNAGLTGVGSSSVAWGDYDNDGRLDILLTGYSGSDQIAQVWRNISPVANTPPSPPVNLTADVSGRNVSLDWSAGTDAQTSSNALTYNLRVWTLLAGPDAVSAQAEATNGWRRLPAMGNAQLGLTAGLTLPPGKYYWSVQAVDTAFAGSLFAPAAQSFEVMGAPQATTLPVSDLIVVGSNASVMLNGTVNPGQLLATAWFEWGATTNYGNTTPAIEFGATGALLPVSHWLSGLARDTTYHVRLVAVNELGSATGADVAFSTQPANLAVNPGFESGTTNWFGFGWSILTPTNSLSHSGAYCGLASNRSNTWCGPAQSLIGLLQTNCTYRISIWVRMAEGGDQTVNMTIQKVDGATSYQTIDSHTVNSTNWVQLSGSYTLSVASNLTALNLYVSGPPPFTNFYVDDLVIEREWVLDTATVSAATTRQTIEGFGGSIAFYNNWLTAHPYKHEIYTNLFAGLNLGMLRVGNWFRYQGVADFDPEIREVVSNANLILGRDVAIEMSSWSPPAFLKSNGQTTDGGSLIWTNGGFAYTNFANYWYDSLLWYKTNGVVPAYISIQNEPDWEAGWDTCKFLPNEEGTNYASYALALAATYQRLTNLPSPPKLLAPEVLGIGYNQVQNYAATMNSNCFYGVGHHLYHGGDPADPDTFISAMQGLTNVFPGKPKFMTEYGEGDMLRTAMLMQHALTVEEVSAYLFWSLVWPAGGSALVQQEFPWDQNRWTNAPPGTPTQPHGYWLTPHYYAMKHFSYFIEPGFKRVEVSAGNPGIHITSFLAPVTNRLVVVMISTNSSPLVVALNINGFAFAGSAVYQTVGTNAQTSRFAPLGAAPPDLQWILPGYSITTVVFDNSFVLGPATNPNPADGAVNVTVTPLLTWSPDMYAASHRVFFGYGSNAVAVATTNSAEYQGDQTGSSFGPGTLASSGRYYWRVDELAGTNVAAGATWTFATVVDPAAVPQASGAMAGSDTFVISFASQFGQKFRVEYSDNLSPVVWIPLADGLAGTGNLIQVTNTGAPFPAQRFYRVVLLAP
jgi:O-glycosyl hydrolase